MPPRKPRDAITPFNRLLILFKGHPGVGKSTVAKALAVRLRCPIIDKDDARDSLSLIANAIDSVSDPIMVCDARKDGIICVPYGSYVPIVSHAD